MSERTAQCLRCGAPANAGVPGARLIEMRGFRARRRVGRSRSHTHDTRHRVAYGYVHADPAFCARRMPGARRRPTDRDQWGGF